MPFTEREKPDSKALAPPNTPVVIVPKEASSPNGSATPSTSSDYKSQTLLNEVSVRLESLCLEDQVSLHIEKLEAP